MIEFSQLEKETYIWKGDFGMRTKKRRRKTRKHFTIIFLGLSIVILMFLGIKLAAHSKNIFNKNEQINITSNPAMDSDWNVRLVNKWNPIPENYEPDLVEVSGGEKVDKRIYKPLMEMLESAKEGNLGQLPMVVSGFRTQEKQQQLFEEKIKEYQNQGYSKEQAEEEAGKWVAVPGNSEHQLGLAVDINGATYDLYLWLQENSYKYGFIFRYPGDKTEITGTAEEVWHYRYVGIEAATKMYEEGICLEEFKGDR